MPDDRPRLCIVGSVNMDLVVRAPRLPAPGETLLGGPFSTSPGGKGANQAVAAARMGAQVSFVGAVGDDAHGRAMIETLKAEGIDTSRVVTRATMPTGVALITVASREAGGENTIVVAPGANATLTPSDVDAARPAISEADILLLQLETPLEAVARAAALARDAGTTVALNAAPAQRLPADLLAALDILIVNESEAAAVVDRSAFASPPSADQGDELDQLLARLTGLGIPTSILTAGPGGAVFVSGREPRARVPACPVTPIDTVGAGDAFCGTFATRLAEHQIGNGRGGLDRMAFFDAVCWANAAGALATLKPGAIPSLPTRAEVVRMLRETAMEAPS
jgi:ribokinase